MAKGAVKEKPAKAPKAKAPKTGTQAAVSASEVLPAIKGADLMKVPQLIDRAEWSPTALLVKGDLSFDEWSAIGAWLEAVESGVQWWVGDWLNYGEARFDEKYAQAVDATGWSLSTLEVYAWVCRKIAPAQRRADLSFSHHKEVADLKPEEQSEWLAKALEGEDGDAWSTDRLRRELKARTDGAAKSLWVLVQATDDADADALIAKLTSEGRTAKRK